MKIDSYCPGCGKETTFLGILDPDAPTCFFHPIEQENKTTWAEPGIWTTVLFCMRCEKQPLVVSGLSLEETTRKIGQYPSLADLQRPKNKAYRGVLDEAGLAELNRAAGLASHGVGIGAFVYLRRIIEKLVNDAFEEGKEQGGLQLGDRNSSSTMLGSMEFSARESTSFPKKSAWPNFRFWTTEYN